MRSKGLDRGTDGVASWASSRDLWAGILFMGAGAWFLWTSLGYPAGSGLRMGPGYFPRLLAICLIILGLVTAGRGLFAARRGGVEAQPFPVGPILKLLLSIALFALLFRGAGLYVTLPLVTLVAASASRHATLKGSIALAVGLTVLCDLLFRRALGLPLPGFGPWFGG